MRGNVPARSACAGCAGCLAGDHGAHMRLTKEMNVRATGERGVLVCQARPGAVSTRVFRGSDLA